MRGADIQHNIQDNDNKSDNESESDLNSGLEQRVAELRTQVAQLATWLKKDLQETFIPYFSGSRAASRLAAWRGGELTNAGVASDPAYAASRASFWPFGLRITDFIPPRYSDDDAGGRRDALSVCAYLFVSLCGMDR